VIFRTSHRLEYETIPWTNISSAGAFRRYKPASPC
jgi:hypothetical protein